MEINFIALLLSALSTLVVGFIWYHPKVFGTIWMNEAGITGEQMKGSNLILIFGMSFFYAFLISFVLQLLVIHQSIAISMVGGEPSKTLPTFQAFMTDYGAAFRTFKHGALHAFMTGLFFALPIIGVGAIYERRSWKYVLIADEYWVITCMIMGGIICGMW